MNYNVIAVPSFVKSLKRLIKKYPSLKDDFRDFINNLELNPEQGTLLSNNCFKIRIAIKSKGKGKSGGARIITHVVIEEEKVYLLSIYDKSEQISVTDKELRKLLENLK